MYIALHEDDRESTRISQVIYFVNYRKSVLPNKIVPYCFKYEFRNDAFCRILCRKNETSKSGSLSEVYQEKTYIST